MTRRQEYWMHLRIIHGVTGAWNRRMSFAAAAEWVAAYQDDVQAGHDQRAASQRAYDYLVYNKHQTLISKEEVIWTY